MISNRYEIRVNKRGEVYKFYTAKPRFRCVEGTYYISLHGNIAAKGKIWEHCLQDYNSYIAANYITRGNSLQNYTADFLPLDTPPPPDSGEARKNTPRNPVKRCRECDRWFHRDQFTCRTGKCPVCRSGDSETDPDKAAFIQNDWAGFHWKLINQHTYKKLTTCALCECNMPAPKLLSSSKKPRRYSKFCPKCWRFLVDKYKNMLKVRL